MWPLPLLGSATSRITAGFSEFPAGWPVCRGDDETCAEQAPRLREAQSASLGSRRTWLMEMANSQQGAELCVGLEHSPLPCCLALLCETGVCFLYV